MLCNAVAAGQEHFYNPWYEGIIADGGACGSFSWMSSCPSISTLLNTRRGAEDSCMQAMYRQACLRGCKNT